MDFIVRKDCKFLRNIYSKEMRENTINLGTSQQYYEVLEKFFKVFILLYGKYKQWKTFVEKTVLSIKISRIFFSPLMNKYLPRF